MDLEFDELVLHLRVRRRMAQEIRADTIKQRQRVKDRTLHYREFIELEKKRLQGGGIKKKR